MVGYWVAPGKTPNDYSPVSMSNVWYPTTNNCNSLPAGTPSITAASECSLPPGTGPIAGETESNWIARLGAMNWDTNKLNIWAEQVAGTLPASYTQQMGVLQANGTFKLPTPASQPSTPTASGYTIAPTVMPTLTPAEAALLANPPSFSQSLQSIPSSSGGTTPGATPNMGATVASTNDTVSGGAIAQPDYSLYLLLGGAALVLFMFMKG